MSGDSAVKRLRQHAGVEPSSDTPSISAATVEPVEPRVLREAVSDFLAVLDALNHELNGPMPSRAVSGKAESVSRDAAYAVAEVVRMLRDADANDEASQVEVGWLAVLAGDVDDVREHVAEEEAARRR